MDTTQRKAVSNQNSFIKGADLSFVPQYESEGRKFYDLNGIEQDPLELAKMYGMNWVRLRIWNDPQNVPESGGWCNLEETLRMAQRIKDIGLCFMLDFHYSDWWADPAKQNKPKAWESLSVDELEEAVYQYTHAVLTTMKDQGLMPDMVQIGNEIRSGMLFPEGSVANWQHLSRFIKAGLQAVRNVDTSKLCRTVIHLDQGGRFYLLEDWFDQALAYGVKDFDVIAVSYYPFWHGDFSDFKQTIHAIYEKYNRTILIAEAAHAYRTPEEGFIGDIQEKITGIPFSPEGQRKTLELIMNITNSLPDRAGLGVVYWEPFSFPDEGGKGWGSNMSVLNPSGEAHEGIKCFEYHPGSKNQTDIAKVYLKEPIVVWLDDEQTDVGLPKLPEDYKCLTWSGDLREAKVKWISDLPDQLTLGIYELNGILEHNGLVVAVKQDIQVESVNKENLNYLSNPEFDSGLDEWQIDQDNHAVKVEIRDELTREFPLPPEKTVYIEGNANFVFDLCQELIDLPAGRYRLSCDALGANTTGVDTKLYIKSQGGTVWGDVFLQDGAWLTYSTNVLTINEHEKITVGCRIESSPTVIKLKSFQLIREMST